jgi:hypothetical protein
MSLDPRLAGYAQFVAFIDIDEFLYNQSGSTVAEYLSEIPADISAIAVNQRIFGSSGLISYEPGFVTEKFHFSTKDDHFENRWFKTIARPERVQKFDSAHTVILRSGSYVLNDGLPVVQMGKYLGESASIGKGTLVLHHYMLKSLEEFKKKQTESRSDLRSRFEDPYFFHRDTPTYANAILRNDLTRYKTDIYETVLRLKLGLT